MGVLFGIRKNQSVLPEDALGESYEGPCFMAKAITSRSNASSRQNVFTANIPGGSCKGLRCAANARAHESSVPNARAHKSSVPNSVRTNNGRSIWQRCSTISGKTQIEVLPPSCCTLGQPFTG